MGLSTYLIVPCFKINWRTDLLWKIIEPKYHSFPPQALVKNEIAVKTDELERLRYELYDDDHDEDNGAYWIQKSPRILKKMPL